MNRDYRRNAKDRAVINVLLTRNVPLKDIADTIGLSLNDLKKFYKPEIAELRPNLHSISNYMPTDQDRKIVASAAGHGMPLADIALLVGPDGISEILLRRHFEKELRTGKARMHAQIANALFRISVMWQAANGGKGVEPTRVNLDAIKFSLERRFGWTAKTGVDLTLIKPASEWTNDEIAAALARYASEGVAPSEEGEE